MAHKSEFVATQNGFSVQDGPLATTKTQVINGNGEWVGPPSVRTATATATGATTGTLTAGSQFVTVTSANADHIVILPPPVPGTVVWLANGATGYELRTTAPATIAINGGTGADAESAIPASTLVRCICTSATTWIGTNFAAAGTVSATQVAA